ncbi:hypothetical protein EVAR_2990_1 [Eumeta japonica]|uniref:Uncharacterized protein n=1 Tax=Eumeta variegata TaxID=151549 RepID=A0A4C1STB2_EUMVA|nr:hypothetical protein EVAR_2990_1 [Eumeta japonica]
MGQHPPEMTLARVAQQRAGLPYGFLGFSPGSRGFKGPPAKSSQSKIDDMRKNRKKDNRPDVPYGILSGSMNIFSQKFGSASRGKQAVPVCVMAYCLAFHYHPKQWTVKLVDNLLEAGDLWYQQCASKLHDHTPYKGICEVLQFGKKQTMVLNGKRMKVLLGEPEVVGYTMSLDPTIYNLCRGLKVFFNDNRAGILLSRVLKVVIWKDKICYFLFDPAGRDSKAYSNFSNGCAALINVKDLNDIIEILLVRSIVDNQKFAIAPLKVLKMIDEKEEDDLESEKELSLSEKATMGYRILNENCAVVNATMHLGDRCFEDAKYRQALTIAVAALTYAKISPPNRWHTKTVDKILRLGTKLFIDCSHPSVMIDLIIDNIPNSIIIGPYACEIIVYKEKIKGQMFATKDCLINIRIALDDFFNKEYSSGILQFNNYTLAIWRQKEMFYLFDPYPRTPNGLRANKGGMACVWMLLNTEAMADIIEKNWNYMPPSTQFSIHAFKVLKLKKAEEKMKLVCSLSDEKMPLSKREVKRVVLETHEHAQEHGIGNEVLEVYPMRATDENALLDEEKLGDIVSLVDSIQDEYLPTIPPKYKIPPDVEIEPKVVSLDSPTVSVTQVVPRWPKPRDKTNEPPDPDPDPEPEPEEPKAPGEGDEEEAEEENAEEEEAGKKEEVEELVLPPPLPPPPPSPQSEPELVPVECVEDEVETVPPEEVPRRILLTADARQRSKMRAMKKKKPQPVLAEVDVECTPSTELAKPHNFKELPDGSQIISGTHAIGDTNAYEILPFVAIMAIVTSYKYSINTWTRNIVNFVLDAAKQLHHNRQDNFQSAPVHIIPKITIGSQAYSAHVSIYREGVTWQLEEVLKCHFFEKHCKGMITTSSYSCAIFKKNCLFYLYDGTPCTALGLRNCAGGGKAAFLRFRTLHELVTRFSFNKDGVRDEQHFVLSRVVVRRVMQEPRLQLPEDYDFYKREPQSAKSKPKIVDDKIYDGEQEAKSATPIGYQLINGQYRIEGTCALKERCTCPGNIKECHFVCVVAMLMATIHPIHTWDHFMIDISIEKGLEIYSKVSSYKPCEKRVIKNLFLDGKFINLNIKKLLVINENVNKSLEQYIKAVLRRLRYVIVTFPECSIVICQVDSYYHLFDPYCSNSDENAVPPNTAPDPCVCKSLPVASWSLYYTVDDLVQRLQYVTCFNNPDFYTFELTSIKPAPRHASINYRLSPLFKSESSPNLPYIKRKKICPTVNEKMYWLDIQFVPWSRTRGLNSVGLERGCMHTMWKDWDIEFPGDLYSLWGTLHPTHAQFEESHRGNQSLAVCTVAIVMTQCCNFSAWTSGLVDGIVINGDKYYAKSIEKLSQPNHEIMPDDLNNSYGEMYPISFSVKFDKVFSLVPRNVSLLAKYAIRILCSTANLSEADSSPLEEEQRTYSNLFYLAIRESNHRAIHAFTHLAICVSRHPAIRCLAVYISGHSVMQFIMRSSGHPHL